MRNNGVQACRVRCGADQHERARRQQHWHVAERDNGGCVLCKVHGKPGVHCMGMAPGHKPVPSCERECYHACHARL